MVLLPAYVEIMLAVGDVEDARNACQELEAIAQTFDTGVPSAIAAEARGAVELAAGEAQNALTCFGKRSGCGNELRRHTPPRAYAY